MDYYRAHELPETYKKCKAYTDNFSKWLIKTAKARGIEYQEEQKKWQESNPKKNSRRKPKHKVPINELVPLAKLIAKTNVPIEDVTGLLDLADAIRARKEVTQYYKQRAKCDEEHPFFISKLVEVKDILWSLFPSRDHDDVIDESQTFTVVMITPTKDEEDAKDESDDEQVNNVSVTVTVEEAAAAQSDHRKRCGPPAKGPGNVALTKIELEMEQYFQALCFLYDFSRIRETVQQAWLDYQSRKINIITAALVTDLAFAVIQQATAALVEDLENAANERDIFKIINGLYEKFEVKSTEGGDAHADLRPEADYKRHFCIDAIRHMQEYQRLKKARAESGGPYSFDAKAYTFMNFLLFFDQFRSKSFVPPLMDNFTKAMRSTTDGSEPWLAFGLAIVYDINVVIGNEYFEPFDDVAEHIVALSETMRSHCEYEDKLWELSNKPDYMSKGETKFSNYFLLPASTMIDWMDQIFDNQAQQRANDGFGAVLFMSYHPVLAGLVYYHYHKTYSAMSVSKIGWFVVALCHLYNAAKLVGGLDVSWPDLDFIIESHGVKRIFVGDPPTDPSLLYDRFRLAMTTSLRNFTKDGRERNNKCVPVSKETIRKKRGLKVYQPLPEKIRDYYAAREDEKWIHLHNLFNHLEHSHGHASDPLSFSELQLDFANAVQALSPKKSKGKKGRNHRNKVKPIIDSPDFAKQDQEDARPLLLSKMKNELRDLELHSQFDYLSFYRRAFSFVTDIRSKVLYDANKEVMRLDSPEEPPDNFGLLLDLLYDLEIQPQDKNAEMGAKDDGLSKDVIAIGQLRKIATLMKETILESGRQELRNAEKSLRSWHYASESMYAIPKGIYHRITFSSTIRRTRRLAIMRSRNPAQNRFAYSPSERRLYLRIVGARKHHISFRCCAYCSLARVCLGKPASKTGSKSINRKGRRRISVYFDIKKRLAAKRCEWKSESGGSEIGEEEWVDAQECQAQ
ncbi:hypothetical protein BDV96DRAFT_605172 [Lophiotrema nucula]|uniref:DUF6604 domain-containing protein n=1 Tax=Lophiotrema nucula TaxID=690887 RepID=A0A6A5YSQ2_9PLEO|nr:hypothetical protein BDV96DRAFT_605172 [Lophiotrema nucula]